MHLGKDETQAPCSPTLFCHAVVSACLLAAAVAGGDVSAGGVPYQFRSRSRACAIPRYIIPPKLSGLCPTPLVPPGLRANRAFTVIAAAADRDSANTRYVLSHALGAMSAPVSLIFRRSSHCSSVPVQISSIK